MTCSLQPASRSTSSFPRMDRLSKTLPDAARDYLRRNFLDELGEKKTDAIIRQAELDWPILFKKKPILAFRGIVVHPDWLKEFDPSADLDVGSWWTTEKSTAKGYSSNGDFARFDDSRWPKLKGPERQKILLTARFPMNALNLQRTLFFHYHYRGPRPFSFRGSEGYLREGGLGEIAAITADDVDLPDHPIVGTSFRVRIETISDRILASYRANDR